ncbi:MAG TPA: endonuclease/exonuclease/phosphatase family protein [Bryobacteraceae bacterium]|nr:endonuclease/exonuclease/phosphatase family protein [Bryobacteraceae bacterium]
MISISSVLAAGPPAVAHQPLTVVSLNAARETDPNRILRDVNRAPAVRDADVLLLQEVAQAPDQTQCVAEHLAATLKRYVVYSPAATGVTDQGLAILSRYPLTNTDVRVLPAYNLVFRSRSRIALSTTVQAPSGPVRVTNAHLDTRINAADRIRQLAPVLTDGFAGRRIVAGDFNTNEFYWVGRLLPLPVPGIQTSRVRDFMILNGFANAVAGSPVTHDLMMRLDWIFARGLNGSRWAVYPLPFSDHHALWVEMH